MDIRALTSRKCSERVVVSFSRFLPQRTAVIVVAYLKKRTSSSRSSLDNRGSIRMSHHRASSSTKSQGKQSSILCLSLVPLEAEADLVGSTSVPNTPSATPSTCANLTQAGACIFHKTYLLLRRRVLSIALLRWRAIVTRLLRRRVAHTCCCDVVDLTLE